MQSSVNAALNVLHTVCFGDCGRFAGRKRNLVIDTTEVRKAADELGTVVADDRWPLPTYREMLFIR